MNLDTPNFKDSCYKTKDDKLHNTIFYRGGNETPEEREERLKNLRENRGTWVYDEEKKCLVRKEEYIPKKIDVDMPQVSLWNPEVTVLATGKRMSKRELKAYCKSHGRVWDNA